MAVPASFDLDVLRGFVAIAEEQSFTRAADRVGRTQAAVSLQLQRLEKLLGKTLIVRGKGGSVELNADGLQLLAQAKELLALNDEVMRSIDVAPDQPSFITGLRSPFGPIWTGLQTRSG